MARVDPYKNFRFLLEIDGITQAGFTEVTGFGSKVATVEYREGGDGPTVRKLPGQISYPDITLKWGVTDSKELYNWHATALSGQVQRKNGSIVLLGDDNTEKLRWNFFAAWPSEISGPDFAAAGDAIALHTLTLTCERLEQA